MLSKTRAALLATAIAAMPLSAAALTTQEATSLTNTIVQEVQGYIQSGASLSSKQASFRTTMDRYADMNAIGRYVLGVNWRSATPAQQAAFTQAFRTYVSNKYGSQFSDYQGAQIAVGGARDLGDRGIVVDSTVSRAGGAPIAVQWQFSDRSGRPLLVDIVAEGVSLLTSERSAIGNMLDRRGGNLDQLIADLPNAG
ncbi:ABC transporter substrate-binding protein [Roseobacter sp. HKCCA0434]|uniref:MlaC/ttg2D family ABC transporter substrate-binding protein n=1 Tax=Roseobacter sp. HKCCA0434 TaxID=3079297 RepID=UPI002905E713|nr:ABC transporter substrate-binding protein [Roseobacter sp. HKCCA0434]